LLPFPSLRQMPPAVLWARYHEQVAALYDRQTAYEEQLRVIDATITEDTEQLGELHSRIKSLEAGQRLLPEILERLGPHTLSPEHQATVKAMATRLHAMPPDVTCSPRLKPGASQFTTAASATAP
jgi:hypothetical protein